MNEMIEMLKDEPEFAILFRSGLIDMEAQIGTSKPAFETLVKKLRPLCKTVEHFKTTCLSQLGDVGEILEVLKSNEVPENVVIDINVEGIVSELELLFKLINEYED